jgi:DNA-binding MarR family transcriptional regulator
LANEFGVKPRTIQDKIKGLEDRGFITRDTKPAKGGRVRFIKTNYDKIEAALTTANFAIVENSQTQNLLLTNANSAIDNSKICEIKDNIQDNIQDNLNEALPVEKEITLEQVEHLLEKGSYYIENNCVYCNDGRKFKLR